MKALNLLEMHHVAENGRMFCALLVLINLFGGGEARLAFMAAIPVGLSCLVAQGNRGRMWAVGVLAIYAITIVAAGLTALKIWSA